MTYRGKPVYLFSLDLPPGAPSGLTNGDNFIDPSAFGVWDTLSAAGTVAPGSITVATESAPNGSTILAADGNATPGGSPSATLYTRSTDSSSQSSCMGACAAAWPPVLTSGPPVAGPGVDPSLLGTIQRPDGNFQVTFEGEPLYYFSQALNSTTTGDGITVFWGSFTTVSAGAS